MFGKLKCLFSEKYRKKVEGENEKKFRKSIFTLDKIMGQIEFEINKGNIKNTDKRFNVYEAFIPNLQEIINLSLKLGFNEEYKILSQRLEDYKELVSRFKLKYVQK